ncbi:X-linked retinitis pigmentosa GTPase regulator isoform X1 [Lucilia cuprina]|uniref:X-linked retinitis pigmentosa GTPase regulator isoform X1 n=1 Tax=Lucilia cuprina TaxID=7375 RepID=UPI001F052854|nr:X-linked retinitis pigmentosa GTPase regulator isoform X1 [Lucilia cuprina]
MDIPNTGAIFTLGKSHLAENTQSYFYIKNDPIKRLIAGPYQSAVICESGRLFVWGENHHGQLGIGGQHSSNASNNNNNNNSNGDIIIKPTCVKSLKTLGLKIADISFGNDWSIILTLSNELFYTGRNIFASGSTVSSNFTKATVNEELCEIIRKPFRLEEFDDCLSNNEEAENFINVLAGNEHFVLLTSFGRLIGWGSNQSHQLGRTEEDVILKPHEIVLDSPTQQFTCGPESTLVLTENGKLYLTGRLNEFVFPDFTELQKNLSSNEQIIFMHISKASEIFIVTNTGSIYRSYESVRNKSLIFQRFYDYDSEENGPIWKLLKGTSFYAVLTKANKFYTTFSESGHHLKTFREISKFKNLRLLDMALGDRHILVHGIPRSSTLAATIGPGGEHRYMTQSMIMANTTGGILNRIRNGNNGKSMELDETKLNVENANVNEREENPKTNTPVNENEGVTKKQVQAETTEKLQGNNNEIEEIPMNDATESLDLTKNDKQKSSAESIESSETVLTNNESSSIDTDNTVVNKKSPTQSLKSQTSSTTSLNKHNETASSSVKSLRPRTPYPESTPHGSPQSTLKKTPMRNFSYEAAMKNDFLEHTSPALVESLENIPEHVDKENAALPGLTVSMPTPPTEDDEELRLEISETTDPLDHTVTVNEIRFINNGIDVTANVKKYKLDGSEDSLDEEPDEEDEENYENDQSDNKSHIRKQAENLVDELEVEIDKKVENAKANKEEVEALVESKTKSFGDKVGAKFMETKDSIGQAAKEAGENVDAKLAGAKETLESAAIRAATGARGAVQSVSENTKKAAKGAKQSMEDVGNSMANARDEARQTVGQIGNNVVKATGEAKDAMGSTLRKMAGDTKHAVGSVTSKISTEVQDAKNSLSTILHGKKNKVDVQKPIEENELEDAHPIEDISKECGGDKSNTTSQSNNTTTGIQEDDERTTASANSNHNSSVGNPFENSNPFESTVPFDPELDAMVERGKQALREELQAASVAATTRTTHIVEDDVVEEKSKFSKFFDDIKERSRGLSCRNEKSVKIVEDQPPRYSVEDELALQPVNGQPNGSKVCTIL